MARLESLGDYTCGCGSKCKVWIKPRSHKRSRPLIQTPDPDLSKGVDPDLWSRPLEWYNIWANVCSYSPCQAAKQQTVSKPRYQAVKLLSCTCCKATLLSCQAAKLHVLLIHAAKLSDCNCCQATKLSSYQAVKQSSCNCWTCKLPSWHCCKARLPSSQAVHLLFAHLVVLFLSHCIQAAIYAKKVGPILGLGPRPIQTRIQTDPDPIQTTTSSVYLRLKTCDC